jgi:hypothetical protein
MPDKKEDLVNHPSHYTQGKLEVIDIIEDSGLDYLLGNCIKYILRAKHKKHFLTDLEKAQWYLARRIKNAKEGK